MKRLIMMSSTIIALACQIVRASCIHCEDYGIVWKNETIESVAGFKFGSAPKTNGTTDVILKLDKPLRDFTMIHLGYYREQLHSVSFLGVLPRDKVSAACARERTVLGELGFHNWETNSWLSTCFGNEETVMERAAWFGFSNCIDIGILEKNYWVSDNKSKEVLAVVFVDKKVKEHLGEVEEKIGGHSTGKTVTCLLRQVRGLSLQEVFGLSFLEALDFSLRETYALGTEAKYYFTCSLSEKYLSEVGEVVFDPGGCRKIVGRLIQERPLDATALEIQDSLLKEEHSRALERSPQNAPEKAVRQHPPCSQSGASCNCSKSIIR